MPASSVIIVAVALVALYVELCTRVLHWLDARNARREAVTREVVTREAVESGVIDIRLVRPTLPRTRSLRSCMRPSRVVLISVGPPTPASRVNFAIDRAFRRPAAFTRVSDN
jgi:hypothetical protein